MDMYQNVWNPTVLQTIVKRSDFCCTQTHPSKNNHLLTISSSSFSVSSSSFVFLSFLFLFSAWIRSLRSSLASCGWTAYR